MMNNLTSIIDLQGCLNLELNHQRMKLECKGQYIRLTFSSFKALREFFAFYRRVKKEDIANTIEKRLSSFSIHYYLGTFFVGESNPHFQSNGPARLFELPHTHLFPKQLIKYFFS